MGNQWLPPELMIIGIPIALAQQMAVDLDESLICRRVRIAYRENRIVIKARSIESIDVEWLADWWHNP